MKGVAAVVFLLFVMVVLAQENCPSKVKCKAGTRKVPNPKHTPTANGCGSMGFKVVADEFEECCNEHDICYDTCGTEKNVCDSSFQKCMSKVCAVPGVAVSFFVTTLPPYLK
jgi:hypothetical protein